MRRDGDRGSATAELAVALPAVVLLLGVGVVAIAAVTTKLGCVATARDVALAVSRGEDASTVDGVHVERDEDSIRVTVSRGVTSCTAVAAPEPGVT